MSKKEIETWAFCTLVVIVVGTLPYWMIYLMIKLS